jgi:disulfide bond formation protein DsbB
MKALIKKYALYAAFIQALIATLGSLYFSEVRKFPPCVLCWYQRICMYPLVLILAVGIWRNDKKVTAYVLPLSIIGGLIAIYHNLLYYNILPEAAAPCRLGFSCTTKFIEYFGFITIPFLSLVAFIVITGLMLAYNRSERPVIASPAKQSQ